MRVIEPTFTPLACFLCLLMRRCWLAIGASTLRKIFLRLFFNDRSETFRQRAKQHFLAHDPVQRRNIEEKIILQPVFVRTEE
jgi:hypothetical protein